MQMKVPRFYLSIDEDEISCWVAWVLSLGKIDRIKDEHNPTSSSFKNPSTPDFQEHTEDRDNMRDREMDSDLHLDSRASLREKAADECESAHRLLFFLSQSPTDTGDENWR